MQVRKETWVQWDLQDLLEDQVAQEDLALRDLKVLYSEKHTCITPWKLHSLTNNFATLLAELAIYFNLNATESL